MFISLLPIHKNSRMHVLYAIEQCNECTERPATPAHLRVGHYTRTIDVTHLPRPTRRRAYTACYASNINMHACYACSYGLVTGMRKAWQCGMMQSKTGWQRE